MSTAYTPQETRWWVSQTQTGLDYSRPVTLASDFAGAVDGVVKSGTPYPANDGTVTGFIVNDTVLGDNGTTAAILINGIVNPTYLPVTLIAAAKTALVNAKSIKLLKADGSFE